MEIDFYRSDAKTLCSRIRHQEKQLRMKRRWLMGLRLMSKSTNAPRQFKTPKFLKNMYLLESFVRDDDVSSENVRTAIERAYGAFIYKQEGHHWVEGYLRHLSMVVDRNGTICPSDVLRVVSSALDDLNNNGLFCLANIATGNAVKFEKTRPQLKKVIKEHLPDVVRRPNNADWIEPAIQLFMDPRNFREYHVTLLTCVSQSHLHAASKVLDRLDDMCVYSLRAMYRMLKGTPPVPQLQYARTGFAREFLIVKVRKICNAMLSRLHDNDELPKRLAQVMTAAGLFLRKIIGISDFPIPEFFHFSPRIEVLQNDILKALQLLEKIKYRDLKDLLPMLDAKAELRNRSFRASVRRYLTEYLFVCSEVDIPKSLFRTLAFINRTSRRQLGICLSKEKMEEELECVLDLSSQLRQIIWELHPDHNIDKEFADAYMDGMESDDDDVELEGDKNCSNFEYSTVQHHGDAPLRQSNCLHHSDEESVGDTRPAVSSDPIFMANGSDSPNLHMAYLNFNGNSSVGPQPEHVARPSSSYEHGFVSPHLIGDPRKSFSQSSLHDGEGRGKNQSSLQDEERTSKNQYIAIQDICDDTSLFAHQLIGRLLEELLQIDDLDIDTGTRSYLRGGASIPADSQAGEAQISYKEGIGLTLVQVVKELMPSFSGSGVERLNELMRLP